jgi:hypothetical protein
MIGGIGNIWDADAEVEVMGDRVRELLSAQLPGLEIDGLQFYREGWGNVAYLVNGSKVFRFSKREAARFAMEYEIQCLQGVRDDLPLRLHRIEFVGRPQDEYPFPFSGYAELPRRTACSVDWTLRDRIGVAPRLGHFLRACMTRFRRLHATEAFPGN